MAGGRVAVAAFQQDICVLLPVQENYGEAQCELG